MADSRTNLDKTKRQVRPSDAKRVVAIHAPDYTEEIEAAMRGATDIAERVWSFVQAVNEYPKNILAALHEHKRECDRAASRLARALLQFDADVSTLARNAGMHYRLRTALAGIVGAWRRCPGLRTHDA